MNKDIEFQRILELSDQVENAIEERFKKLLGTMSYFNAAEGAFSTEKKQRESHQVLLKDHVKVMLKRGYTLRKLSKLSKEYLVSERDYLPRE